MSYVDVGRDYEKRLLKEIEDDPEEGCIFPCFAESCTDEILQMRVSNRLEEALNDPDLNLPVIISIFGQYLYDTYKVGPEDIEFMCQVVVQGMFREIGSAAAAAAKLVESGDVLASMVKGRKRRNIIDFPTPNKD